MAPSPRRFITTERLRVIKSRRRRHRAAFLFPVALIGIDAAMAALSFWLAFRLRLLSEYTDIPPFSEYYRMVAIYVVAMVGTYFMHRLYERRRSMGPLDETARVIAATSIGTIVTLGATSFFLKNIGFDYPRLMVFYSWGLTIVLVMVGRLLHAGAQRWLHAQGVANHLVLLVSGGDQAHQVVEAIQRSPSSGYRLAGIVPAAGQMLPTSLQAQVLGDESHLRDLVDAHAIDEVIIALPKADPDHLVAIIHQVQREKVTIKVLPDLFQFMAGEMMIGDLGGMPMMTVRDIKLRGWKLAVKRIVDIVVSSIALVLLSPLMMLVALIIKLESGGSVFFTQLRMGLDAKPFRLIKFRSMRPDAEKLGTWTTENDPRVTAFGRFIRRTSIDEFPQLINVLLGEMSIVGPRPEQPRYVEEFQRQIPRYMDRHREKAGITGWAQVNGLRGDTSIQERTKYDVWYTENWSLSLDFKIMVRTALKLFFDRSAY